MTTLALFGSLLAGGADGPRASGRVAVSDLRLVAQQTPAEDQRQVRRELRRSLRQADRGRGIPRATLPRLARLKQNKWDGPERCTANPGDVRSDICPLGAVDGTRTVVLLGDSHLNMWVRGLEGPAAQAGITLVPLIKFGCTPYEVRMWRFDLGPWDECFAWREWAHDQVRRLSPDLVITSGHRTFTMSRDGETAPMPRDERNRAFRDGVAETVGLLRESTDEVVVLGDINYLEEDPKRCLERRRASMRRCESPFTRATRRHNRAIAAGAADAAAADPATTVRFEDPNDLLCLRGRCPVLADLTFMYFDYFHVSRRWSRHVGPVLAPRIGIAPAAGSTP